MNSTTKPAGTKPISGDMMECFKHFVDTHGFRNQGGYLPKRVYRTRNTVAMALGIKNSTLHDWIIGAYTPAGVKAITLRVFLAVCGYKVTELERLDPNSRRIAEFVGYSLAEFEDIGKAIEASSATILHQISCGEGMPEGKASKILRFLEPLKGELERRKKIWRDVVSSLHGMDDSSGNVSAPSQAIGAMPSKKDDVVSAAAALIRALLPLAEFLASNKATPDDRSRLRDACGGNGLFAASTALNQLCSESARKQVLSTGNGAKP